MERLNALLLHDAKDCPREKVEYLFYCMFVCFYLCWVENILLQK